MADTSHYTFDLRVEIEAKSEWEAVAELFERLTPEPDDQFVQVQIWEKGKLPREE